MADSTNRVHVSPGVYASDTVDMKTAANSLGITKLAVVGETLKGPAFQPYWISSQKEYENVFGGTSAKKFKGSNYPKYEAPYIAKQYLTKSNQLCVVRTLGFSGYNAGPAWLITGRKNGSSQKYVIAVLRSKGSYQYRAEFKKTTTIGCQCDTAYDSLTYDVGETTYVASCADPKRYNSKAVKLTPYYSLGDDGNSCTSYSLGAGDGSDFTASSGDLGRFTIKCIVGTSDMTADAADENIEASGYTVANIPVSLNKADNDYILNVLGTSATDGSWPLYVETLYDVAWENLVIGEGFDAVDQTLTFFEPASTADYSGLDAVTGILTKHSDELTKKDIGKRFLYAPSLGSPSSITVYDFDYSSNSAIKYIPSAVTTYNVTSASSAFTSACTIYNDECFQIKGNTNANGYYINQTGGQIWLSNTNGNITDDGGTVVVTVDDLAKGAEGVSISNIFKIGNIKSITGYKTAKELIEGKVYTVASIKDGEGVRHYIYKEYNKETIIDVLNPSDPNVYDEYRRALDELIDSETEAPSLSKKYSSIIYNYEDSLYYKKVNGLCKCVACDLNDYKSGYRYSSTPWIVSNAKGDANHIELNKLFRFHTISDGATSVSEVKVSIENIRPDTGQFDVVVRDYNDSDASSSVLERYSKCTMSSGKKFIGYMIGTIDGEYESKSKYITVEVSNSSAAVNSVPAGFLGYSIPLYSEATIASNGASNVSIAPMMYNTTYDEDVNKKKQYFGVSDIINYDYDYFSYKGKMSTLENPKFMSHGFHLDCRVNKDSYGDPDSAPIITVDGEDGYIFDTVSVNARTNNLSESPIIASEDDMYGCIYEDIKLRKFTLAFAGGFDGWDEYRTQRTNTDEYTASSYKGYINKNNGVGYAFDSFSTFSDSSLYNLDGGAITSDYYSTLAGVSLLKNPEEVDINLLATPGIDTINNAKLVGQIFEILEDRADTFYVVTTPDKETGTGDFESDVQDVDYTVSDFVDQDLYCDYAATYYPWVKIEDDGQYIFLPATKDVVTNMAESDNTNTTQNLAPAGKSRGKVDAIRARKNLKVTECDTLYENSINPVRTYARDGIIIMGQKTLRESDDIKNRIDVMRCLLRMRKLLAIATLGLIFDPNDDTTVKSFKSIVNGVMQTFIDNRAIEKWKMDVDTSEEAKDRLEINATIYFKPIRALEYINFNFVVTNKDSYFE